VGEEGCKGNANPNANDMSKIEINSHGDMTLRVLPMPILKRCLELFETRTANWLRMSFIPGLAPGASRLPSTTVKTNFAH
jgi:hypothetical protein